MPKNSNILALNSLGQSVWYDNLSRDVLRSGVLEGLISSGVSGLTSNPTIFKKAIADSDDYDSEIKAMSEKGLDAEALCEELMIQDVGNAADLLRPIYDETAGKDGFASIEVSPLLAADVSETISAADRIWKKLNRPNIMIKIPATPQGIPAIRETLKAGINVNVTLIFSVASYETVMEAYLSALEDRLSSAESVSSIASVASFFVSRVDGLCEKKFDQLVAAGKCEEADKEKILGKIGIANSKLAYAQFEQIFATPRFQKLEQSGASLQRPLWASTSTKNPNFRKVLYVEELAGKHTVNTLPPATLDALCEGALIEPRLHSGLEAAQGNLAQLAALGISLDEVLAELLDAGVESFAQSYKELLTAIHEKQKALAA